MHRQTASSCLAAIIDDSDGLYNSCSPSRANNSGNGKGCGMILENRKLGKFLGVKGT